MLLKNNHLLQPFLLLSLQFIDIGAATFRLYQVQYDRNYIPLRLSLFDEFVGLSEIIIGINPPAPFVCVPADGFEGK